MDEKELKEEFIKWFGVEKWNELELEDKVQRFTDYIAASYLCLPTLPVIFMDNMDCHARLDAHDMMIYLNPEDKEDKVLLLQSVCHELEHYYQIVYSASKTTKKALLWKKELNNYTDIDDQGYYAQSIEIDAIAFAQIVMLTEFGICRKFPDENYQLVIDEYIQSRKILEE